MNSRFANAAGFGSLSIANISGIPPGRAITSINAEINVINNVVKARDPSNTSLVNKYFVLTNASPTNGGIRTLGNSFQSALIGHSSGIVQLIVPMTD